MPHIAQPERVCCRLTLTVNAQCFVNRTQIRTDKIPARQTLQIMRTQASEPPEFKQAGTDIKFKNKETYIHQIDIK
jgi:hypothetical protein